MNLNKNYYQILNIDHNSSDKEIKKSYYKLSFELHTDKGGDQFKFAEISEAYGILSDLENRIEYDKKSRFGKDYNEFQEFFNIDFDFDWKSHNSNYEKFKKNDILDIRMVVDDNFDGSIKFERWVVCKDCKGSGKDLLTKIQIKDEMGNVLSLFDSEDGCDFCEGTGKDFLGGVCRFCTGAGKVGASDCKKCSGNGRILGIQQASNIKLEGDTTKIKSMGNFSKTGEVGDLVLIKSTSPTDYGTR